MKKIRSFKTLGFAFFALTFFGISITLIADLAMYNPVEVSTITHVILPIILMVVLGMETTFGYVKLSTLIVGRVFIISAALGYGETYIVWIGLTLLLINVLEAVIMDLTKKEYFNGMIGVALVGTAFFMNLEWEGTHLLNSSSFIYWILAYTIWDWFIVLKHSEGPHIVGHTVILVVPIIYIAIQGDSATWLMMRELTLSFGIVVLAFFRKKIKPWVYTLISPNQFDKLRIVAFSTKVQVLAFIVNAGLIIGYISTL
jgi:hypothetical protein